MTEETNQWRNKIEDEVSSLSSRMSADETSLQAFKSSITNSVEALTRAFDSDRERQRDAAKTPWPIILGTFTLLLVIMGGIASVLNSDTTRLENNATKLTELVSKHMLSKGHLPITQKVVGLEETVKQLDITLQRELGLMVDDALIQLADLDAKIQTEIGLETKAFKASVDNVKRRTNRIEDWQMKHDQMSIGMMATQGEKINANRTLIQMLFGELGAQIPNSNMTTAQ